LARTIVLNTLVLADGTLSACHDAVDHDVECRDVAAYDQLDQNIQIGAAVGLVAGLCIASILGGPLWTLAFGAVVCAFAGAILGLLLWLEVADFPAEPIVRMRLRDSRDDRRQLTG
jgi:hypothetical protein